MVKLIVSVLLPIVLAPVACWALRPLFAYFIRQGAELFLERDVADGEVTVLGRQLAMINVLLFVVTWLVVVAASYMNLALSLRASLAIAGVVVALSVSILFVRTTITARGWGPTQVGLLSFAGGNLPLFLVAIVSLMAF